MGRVGICHPKSAYGMTLVELLIAMVLFIAGAGGLFLGMHYAMAHAQYLRQMQITMNAAQGRLEQMASTNFDLLAAGTVIIPGETVVSGNALTDQLVVTPAAGTPLATIGGQFALQVRPVAGQPIPPNLLDLHVAACWRNRGRAIGELNGAILCQDRAAGEPASNWWVDSPAMASTRIARSGS